MEDIFRATPGSYCAEQGHDGMSHTDHWEAHNESVDEIRQRAKLLAESGWKTFYIEE